MATYEKQVTELSSLLSGQLMDLEESAEYYDACYRLETIGLAAPPEMRVLSHVVGWPRMYLDSLEERLDVEGFRLAGQSRQIQEMWEWWQANNMDEESCLAHLDAFIYGRSYVTVAAPGDGDLPGVPLIRVESPRNFYAEVDPRTRKVKRAIRVYSQVTPPHTAEIVNPQDARATLYLPNETVFLVSDNGAWRVEGRVQHNLGVVPVVPIYNRQRAGDREGRSEILPEIRAITDAASRTLMNMQAATEMMATPQRYIFGVPPEALGTTDAEIREAYMGRLLTFEDAEGKAGQFTAAELRNFVEVLQELAKHVASYTGLPPQYLSFSSDNPASAEAIRSSESRLVKKCERKARMFGGAWEEVMRLCLRVLDREVPPEMARLETVWRDPATPTFAAKADAVTKLYSNGMGIIPKEFARIEMGFTDEQRREMREWDRDDETLTIDSLLRQSPNMRPSGDQEVEAT